MTIINNYTFITIFLLLLLSQYARAQTGEPESKSDSGSPGEGHHYQPSILLIILNLGGVFVFMAIFCFLIRFCTNDTSMNNIVVAQRSSSCRRSRGLDMDVIEGFPILDYAAVKAAKIGKDALECAVCLAEFEDDDSLRLIPRCDHVFHPDCIDAWLFGHTTCPVCRCNLAEKVDNDVVLVNDVVINIDEVRESNNSNDCVNEENESMDRPLHERMRRSRTMRNQSFGRPRWFGKLVRSLSTGHVEVKKLESTERFTLRLPEDVRKQIMNGKLKKRNSGKGLYPSRGLFGSLRDRATRSGHWGFSLTPPFLTPARSVRSHDGEASRPTRSRASSWCGPSLGLEKASTSREISLCNNMKAELNQLPV